jgi:hypothetical protein
MIDQTMDRGQKTQELSDVAEAAGWLGRIAATSF